MAHRNENIAQNQPLFFMKFLVEKLDDKALTNKGDVLRHYFFLTRCRENETFQEQKAKKVVAKVLKIWFDLGIQTTTSKNCLDNFKKLWFDYLSMKKKYEESLPMERQLILDAWMEECDLLFFAEKRGTRDDCKPEIKKLLTEADTNRRQFGRKDVPYERYNRKAKTRAKGPEAGPSHVAATDANNNAPQSPSKAQTTAAPSPKRPLIDASNDLASSEVKRRRAIATLFEPAELAESSTRSTKRNEEKIRYREKKSSSSTIHDGDGHHSTGKHRTKNMQPAKETVPANSSGEPEVISEAEAIRRYTELMVELYGEDFEKLEALGYQLATNGCDADKNDLQVDVQSTEDDARMENNIEPRVETEHTEKVNLAIASSACSKKYADAKSTLAETNVDGKLASQANSLEHRRLAPKKSRLDAQVQRDKDTTTGKKSANVNKENSVSPAKLAEKPTDIGMPDNQGDSLDHPKEAAIVNARISTSTAVTFTVKAQQNQIDVFNQVGTSGGTADQKDDAKNLEDGEIMEQQVEVAVEASSAKKHTEKQTRSFEEIADAETPENQADSTSCSEPARKKSRLDVPAENDDGHSLDKEVPAESSQSVAEVAHSNISNNGSNTIRPIVNLELATKALPAYMPTADDNPPFGCNIAPQLHQNIDIDPQQEALLRAMHAYSSAPEKFRAQLLHARWPPKSAWSDHELLEAAISFQYEDIVVVLLQEGARVWRDGDGPRAFHKIIELGSTDVVELCLARGARVAEQDSAGNTALHVAFLNRKPEDMMQLLARRLVEETSVSVTNCVGLSTWHLLCGPGSDANLVELVLSRGYVDVNAQVPSTNPFASMPGYTALHVAVKYSQLETARVLLNHGANLHARNNTNSTPLHLACSLSFVPMVDLLLSHDDCLDDLVDDYGITHFMCACIGTRLERVQEFVRAVQSQPWESTREMLESQTMERGLLPGCTPLLLAKRFDRRETVKLLLSYRPPDVQCDLNDAAPLPVPAPINAVITGIRSVVIQIDDSTENSRVIENL